MTEPIYIPGTEEKDPQKVIMSLQQIKAELESAPAAAVSDAAGTATPLMDGTAAVGTSAKWAHDDHRHPSDASKVSVDGGETLTGGYYITVFDIGNWASFGVANFDAVHGNYQAATNNGAITLTVPPADSAVDVLVTNAAGAGAITFSGFTVGSNTGDPLTTTVGHKFIISFRRMKGVSTYMIKALQ